MHIIMYVCIIQVLIYSKNLDTNEYIAEYSNKITDGTNYTHPSDTSQAYIFQV